MATNIKYEIGVSLDYAEAPVVQRVVTVNDLEISRDFATLDEILSDSAIEQEYLSTLAEYFNSKAASAFNVGSLSDLDFLKLFELRDCLVYLLQNLARPTLPEESE